MLSRKTKARIARNRKRRVQCRTKNGRDLFRLIRSMRQRTTNRAVEFLLGMKTVNDIHISGQWKTGITQFLTDGPKALFKRPEVNVGALMDVSPRNRNNRMIADDIILGIDPGAKPPGGFTVVRVGKLRGAGGPFKIDFSDPRILDEAHLTGNVHQDITTMNAQERVNLIESAVAPSMVKYPDGRMEILGWNLVDPGPGQKDDVLRHAMKKFREGMDKGETPFVTLDSYNDFKESNSGTDQSSQSAHRPEQKPTQSLGGSQDA